MDGLHYQQKTNPRLSIPVTDSFAQKERKGSDRTEYRKKILIWIRLLTAVTAKKTTRLGQSGNKPSKLGLTNRDGSPLQFSRVQGRKTTRGESSEVACASVKRDEGIRSNYHWSKWEKRLEREKKSLTTTEPTVHGLGSHVTRRVEPNPRTMNIFYLSSFRNIHPVLTVTRKLWNWFRVCLI